MTPVKLLIVAAAPGARADFVAGWLGTTPEFLNSNWNIDPETGISLGAMGNLRSIDTSGQDPELALQNWNLKLSAQAKITWAVSCHGFTLQPEVYRPYIDTGAIKFVSIDTSAVSKNLITWEFIVKTFMTKRRALDWVQRNQSYVVDEHVGRDSVTDQQRQDFLIKILNSPKLPSHTNQSLPKSIPSTHLNYTELFQPNGSKYLCHRLNMKVADHFHQLWNAMLNFSNSSTEIAIWGTTWKKSDWLAD